MGWFGGSNSSTAETPKDFSSSDDSAFSAASQPQSGMQSAGMQSAGMGSTGLQQFAAEQQQRAMIQQVRGLPTNVANKRCQQRRGCEKVDVGVGV